MMRPTLLALYIVWVGWGFSWIVASFWADKTIARPAAARELRYRVFTFTGWTLLLVQIWSPHGEMLRSGPWAPLWRLPAAAEWAFVALALAGCAFCWWARLHLGRLWSAALTRKADHHVVDTGPYAIVRHPIYTGLYLAAIATCALRASIAVSIGLLLFLFGYWVKAREEERFLAAELGEQAYADYRRRVPMLIPFGWK